MGLYEGGLLMTLIYISVIVLFVAGGVANSSNSNILQFLRCIPNDPNITQYGGLDSNTSNVNNCITTQESTTGNIATTQTGAGNSTTTLLGIISGLVPGGSNIVEALTFIFSVLFLLPFGWIFIFQTIFAGGQLAVFIFILGVPLQILQIYFLFQIGLNVIGILAGLIGRLL